MASSWSRWQNAAAAILGLIVLALAAIGLTAACSSGSTRTVYVPAASAPATRATPDTGPFAVAMVSCGALSAVQQTQFGTNAARGCVYKVTSHDSQARYVDVTVTFADGATVVDQGYAGLSPELQPGQTWYGEADNAVDSGGNGQPWASGEITGYGVFSAPAEQVGSTYQAVKPTALTSGG